jgi:hypothetical protein
MTFDGIRLLDTAAPGGSLLAHSRLVLSASQPGEFRLSGDGVLTPDGKTIVAPMQRPESLPASASNPTLETPTGSTTTPDVTPDLVTTPTPNVTPTAGAPFNILPLPVESEYKEFSAATGQSIRVFPVRQRTIYAPIRWTNSAGSVIVAVAVTRDDHAKLGLDTDYEYVVLSGRQFVPIPGVVSSGVTVVGLAF